MKGSNQNKKRSHLKISTQSVETILHNEWHEQTAILHIFSGRYQLYLRSMLFCKYVANRNVNFWVKNTGWIMSAMVGTQHLAPGHNKLTNTPTHRQTDRCMCRVFHHISSVKNVVCIHFCTNCFRFPLLLKQTFANVKETSNKAVPDWPKLQLTLFLVFNFAIFLF